MVAVRDAWLSGDRAVVAKVKYPRFQRVEALSYSDEDHDSEEDKKSGRAGRTFTARASTATTATPAE